MPEFDYVIIGAGSAGCVLANRLSADGSTTVCILEAGPSDRSIFIQMPAALTFPIESKIYNWQFESEPEAHLNGRRIGQARGRCLGGSSAINGMVFVRGNARDYDGWADQGLPDWSFERCLPYFRRMETYEGGASQLRGGDGPTHVIQSKADHIFYQAFLRAGEQFGQPLAEDYNGEIQDGAHITQATIKNGVRCSTASAYLRPAMARTNLTVETDCLVERIVFSHRRAIGVEFSKRGRTARCEAGKEIILCAGTIGSPQILMLSGVGDADHLGTFDIAALSHLPGVGQHLEDHVVAPVRFRSDKPVSINRQLGLLGRLKLGAEWLFLKKGLGTSNFFEVGSFFKSTDGIEYVNIQHEFLPFLADFQHGKVSLSDGFQYFVNQMRPQSKGHIRLKSADPKAHPAIHFNYLSDPADVREMIDAVKITREIAKQRAWDSYRGVEIEPGPDLDSDSGLESWLRNVANTEHHPVGTCRMGTDLLAVTDSAGLVHGLEGLRVVDASIIPKIPTANMNAPVIMIAEKISDAILDDGR